MIRKYKPADKEKVMQLWLAGNLSAHAFIDASYWKKHYARVAEMLDAAEIYVMDMGSEITGFIGLNDDLIAGLFVAEHARSMGFGRELLEYVKKLRPYYQLCVYKKNQQAFRFYVREGFIALNEQLDSSCNEIEIVMKWVM